MILHNPEQIPLFEDEFMLLNDAAAALKALRLDDALESLKRYSHLYRGGEDVTRKVEVASFKKDSASDHRLSSEVITVDLWRNSCHHEGTVNVGCHEIIGDIYANF
jgi:hypothetical protein